MDTNVRSIYQMTKKYFEIALLALKRKYYAIMMDVTTLSLSIVLFKIWGFIN